MLASKKITKVTVFFLQGCLNFSQSLGYGIRFTQDIATMRLIGSLTLLIQKQKKNPLQDSFPFSP